MVAIACGNTVSNRASYLSASNTYVDINAPADGTGHLTTVTFWVNSPILNMVVFVAEPKGNNVFRVRSRQAIGDFGVGLQSDVPIDLAVHAGDCIGWYATNGQMEADNTGGLGCPGRSGDYSALDTHFWYNSMGAYICSILGYGETQALGPEATDVYDELDRMYAEDYPGAEAWLGDNWDFEAGPLVLAQAARNTINGGGAPGGGLTLAELRAYMEDPLEAFQVRMDAAQTMRSTYAGLIRDDIGVVNAPATGLLAALTTHDSTIGTSVHDHTQEVLDAIALIGDPDLSSVLTAITTHDGYSNDRRDTILAAIAGVAAVVGVLQVGRTIMSVADAIKAVVDTIDSVVDTLPTSVPDYSAELADMDADLTNISNKIDALDLTPSLGWPGLASVTLSTPVGWTGAAEIAEAMDGCLVHIASEPSGTGKDEIGAKANWRHAGWLAFVSDRGDIDEIQWLGPTDAVYVPKRMVAASSVLIFPRANSSGTLTPWTRNP